MKKCLVTHRVKSFEIIAPYTIRVQFEDDASQTINFKLYHWPDYENLYAERVKEWEGAHVEQHS